MNSNKNIFKDKKIKILIAIFIILSISHIIVASLFQRGAIADGSLWLIHIFDGLSSDKWSFESLYGWRPRALINIINQTPLNIGYHLFHITSKYWLSVLFSLPLFMFPFLFPLFQYRLAKRSNRYDIVVCSILLYSLFILPASLYAVVEVYLAASLILMLFHYLAAKIDYTKLDMFFIIILAVFLYNSSEAVIYCGILIFIASLFYSRKTDSLKNKIVKMFIGINGLISSVFVLVFCIIHLQMDFFMKESTRFIYELSSQGYGRNYFTEPAIILIITLILFIPLTEIKKTFSTKSIIIFSLLYTSLFVFILQNKYSYIFSEYFFSYRVIIFIALPIIILSIMWIDYFKKRVNKVFWSNLLIIVCLAGIVNTAIQFTYTYYFSKFINRFITKIEHNNKIFLDPEKDLKKLYNSEENIYMDCDTYVSDSILFQEFKDIDTIVLPDRYEEACPKRFYINKNKIYAPYYSFRIRNKFWDLSTIIDEAEDIDDIFYYEDF